MSTSGVNKLAHVQRVSAVLGVALMMATSLAGCSPFRNEFVELVRANDNVAAVASSGGGYSDSRWVVRVSVDSGIDDDEVAELVDDLQHDLEQSSGTLPGELIVELGNFEIYVREHWHIYDPSLNAEVSTRVENWIRVRDDERIQAGRIGPYMGLLVNPVDAFAVAGDYADSEGGVIVGDELTEGLRGSISVDAQPQCDQVASRLAVFESLFGDALANDALAGVGVQACGESQVWASSKGDVLALSRAASAAFAEAGFSESLSVYYSEIDDSTGRDLTWTLTLTTPSAELDALLDELYSSSAVAGCEFSDSGLLSVLVYDDGDVSSIESLIEKSGAEFDNFRVDVV